MPNRLRGLYAITPETPDGARLLADVEAALAGGCRIVQYRDKTSPPPERVARAHALRRLTRSRDATLIINDDMALAFLVKADGLHLGREDGNLAAARAILGPERILGASCYADFSAAQKAKCDRRRLRRLRGRLSVTDQARCAETLRSTCFFAQNPG